MPSVSKIVTFGKKIDLKKGLLKKSYEHCANESVDDKKILGYI